LESRDTGRLDARRIIPVMKKEFLHIVRDTRSLVIALLAPVILLVLYAYAVTFDITRIDLGVVDYDHSSISRQITEKFAASGYFEIDRGCENSMAKCVQALRMNGIKMILVIPRNLYSDIKKSREVKLQVIGDGSDSNTVSIGIGYSQAIIAQISAGIMLETVRSRGFDTKAIPMIEPVPRVWYNPELKSTNYIVPGLAAIIMMLISALLTSLTIVREKEHNTYEQLVATPLKPLELMIGKIVPYIILCLIDVTLIVSVGILWFHVPFKGNILVLSVYTILFLFCALGLGLIISAVSENQQVAVMGTALGTLLPSILLSGFVFPIASMPGIIQALTYLVPAKYYIVALRTIFLKAGTGFFTIWGEGIFLLIFGTIFIAASAKSFKKTLD
jgi:ABC-2 type transport system permease protein